VIAAAGQTYRAKAKHGHRYVRVVRVRGDVATVREVSAHGNEISGRDRRGMRAAEFYVQLHGGSMPLFYELVDSEEVRSCG
jgi:hypothetical protein